MGSLIVEAFAAAGSLAALVLGVFAIIPGLRALRMWADGQAHRPEFKSLHLTAMRRSLVTFAVLTVTLLPSSILGFRWDRVVLVRYFEVLAVAGVVAIIYWRVTRGAKQR